MIVLDRGIKNKEGKKIKENNLVIYCWVVYCATVVSLLFVMMNDSYRTESGMAESTSKIKTKERKKKIISHSAQTHSVIYARVVKEIS